MFRQSAHDLNFVAFLPATGELLP